VREKSPTGNISHAKKLSAITTNQEASNNRPSRRIRTV